MNKQEFLDLVFTKLTTKSDLETELDDLIASEIEAYEKAQWKKYPENVPKVTEILYLETFDIKSVHSLHGFNFNAFPVIAFRELPKPYQP